MLTQGKTGFVDLAGNFLLDLPGAYLDRRVPGNVKKERRAVRPLFTPAAARVLRVLLTTAGPWKVQPLSEAARVSPGHVSHVRRMLCDYGWASVISGGLQVTNPEEILSAWRKADGPAPTQKRGYTTLHGAALATKLSELLAADKGENLLLAGASAANYLAPYLRTSVIELRATSAGLAQLQEMLSWKEVSEGANVLVELTDNPEDFADKVQPAPAVFSTDQLTTYLALSRRGDRHAEAAEHLRLTSLLPQWRRLGISAP